MADPGERSRGDMPLVLLRSTSAQRSRALYDSALRGRLESALQQYTISSPIL